MAIVRASPGEQLAISASFRGNNGSVLAGTGSAVWVIRAPDGSTVANGVGVQDSVDPAIWTGTALLPQSLPVSTGTEKYILQWRLPLVGEADAYASELFTVETAGDASILARNTDVLTAAGQPLVDVLYLDAPGNDYAYRVIDEAGTEKIPASSFSFVTASRGAQLLVQARCPAHTLAAPGGAIGYYLGVWSWTDSDGLMVSESHPIYLVTPKAAGLIINLRKLIDRARMNNITPYLSFTDADLLHYILRGIEWVNGAGNHLTSFNLSYIGYGLTQYIEKAAALEAVRAQALAESQTSGDFQGLGVQLNTDRAQYWNDLAQQLQAELEGVTQAKKAWEQAGKPTDDAVAANPGSVAYKRTIGVLGISVGAHSNYLYPANPYGDDLGGLSSNLALSSLRRRWGNTRL